MRREAGHDAGNEGVVPDPVARRPKSDLAVLHPLPLQHGLLSPERGKRKAQLVIGAQVRETEDRALDRSRVESAVETPKDGGHHGQQRCDG